MQYEYRCTKNHTTIKFRPIRDREEPVECRCGLSSEVKLSFAINSTFGWKLSDKSLNDVHSKDQDEYVRNI